MEIKVEDEDEDEEPEKAVRISSIWLTKGYSFHSLMGAEFLVSIQICTSSISFRRPTH
jgi:hypothetical protein